MSSLNRDLRELNHKTTCSDSIFVSREVEFSGIPSGCCYQGDSVPGVSASLQPPATICDRFAIKIIVPNLTISPTNIVAHVERHCATRAFVVISDEFRPARQTATI